jgi:hypothetical protein
VTLFAWIGASVVGAFRAKDEDSERLLDDKDKDQ